MQVYFGDIHGHASVSPCYWSDCPTCDPQSYFDYARRISGLDFAALTEHDHSLDAKSWSRVCHAVKTGNDPGQFVTMLGYEWTSIRYGHQNVYFQDDEGPVVRCRENDQWVSPEELWQALEGSRGRVITVPHHVGVTQFPADWSFYNERYQPVSEVTSLWGDFVQFGQGFTSQISNVLPSRYVTEALENGYRFGFVGGGDSHDCRPGQPGFGGRKKPNFAKGQNLGQNPLAPPGVEFLSDDTCNFRGITGVWADSLTRDALWEAILQRHTYATTGARIRLKVMWGNHLMGDVVEDLNSLLTIDVLGTTLIDKVIVYVNGDPVWSVEPSSDRGSFQVDLGVHARHDGFCYVGIEQSDGHRAWSSPMWWTSGLIHEDSHTLSDQSAVDVIHWTLEKPTSDSQRADSISVAVEVKPLPEGCYLLNLTLPSQRVLGSLSGTVDISGAARYRVREHGFITAKYGGDLWTRNESSVAFYLPKNAQREMESQLQIVWRADVKRPTDIKITVQGVSSIRILEESQKRMTGNTVSLRMDTSHIPNDFRLTACEAHGLLPWP